MFSSRTDWNLTPNALSILLETKRRAGEHILDLTESNPMHCGFSHDPALLRSLAFTQSYTYEPDPRGLISARRAIADFYSGKGFSINPDNIFLTASTSEAYSYLFRLLCDPGHSVLVPKPSYPLFDYLCRLNDVEATFYRLRYNDGWYVDFDSLQDALNPSTQAILLVYPNNPTGSFIKRNEREKLLAIARQHELAVIADEVFGEFPLVGTGDQCGSFAAEESNLVFTLNGISKMLGLPQMKLAWITISGSAGEVGDAAGRLEIISDTYLSVGTPVQQALPELLLKGQEVTKQIARRLEKNFDTLRSHTAEGPISLFVSDGGWNAILRLPNIFSDDAWAARMLKQSNVFVHPGHFFEIEQDSCIVVSLLPEEGEFSEGLSRLHQCVQAGIQERP